MPRALAKSQYRDWQVRKKTREVRDYHYDDSRPGKPLHVMVPGGLVALGALLGIITAIYRGWFDQTSVLTPDGAMPYLFLLTPIYIGGVFLFSYGYELYNIERAIRLTVIIVFVTLAAVVIVGALGALLGGSKDSGGSSSSNSKSGRSSSGSSGRSSLADHFKSDPVSSRSSTTWEAPSIEINLDSSSDAVPVPAAPPPLLPVACQHCQSLFIPEETKFLCPQCGSPVRAAATA